MTALLLKLLGVKIDNAVRVSGATLSYHGVGAGWMTFLLALMAAAVWWLYRRSPVTLPAWRRRLLTALRTVFLALVLLLLLRPVLAFTVEGSVRRLLVLLLDTSASMQIKDPRVSAEDHARAAIAKNLSDPSKGLRPGAEVPRGPELDQASRLELVKEVLKNDRLRLLPRLEGEFDLGAFTFGQGLADIALRRSDVTATNTTVNEQEAAAETAEWVNRLQAASPGTALGDAIREVIQRKRGQPVAGIVVVTDGANNSGSQPRDAAAFARQENVPLYTYGVGITSPRDIIVGNLFAPDVTFVKDEVPITVRIRSQGLAGEKADLVLKLGETVVAEQSIALNEGEQVVSMKFTPEQAGEWDLSARIEPRPDETVKDNNSQSQRLRVIDAKIKVLLVDQSPRWEFRYLQAMLLRDRRVELKCFLAESDKAITRAPGSPYLAEFPARKEDLFQYDLVFFGDLDPKALTPGHLENLSEWVSKFGGALVMVAGRRFSPNAYRRTILDKMLPVEFESPTSVDTKHDIISDKPIQLELTALGRSSPMLRLSDKDEENVALWKKLPPVYWVAKVSRAKPAAEVLLVDSDPAKESRFGKMPVVAMQPYGLGQVLYVGTDNTWRWRRNVGELYYTTLWGQIAQRISIQRLLGVSRRTQLTADRQSYRSGDRASVFARLYTAGFDPIQDNAVKGFFRLKEGSGPGSEVTLRPIPEQPGLYRAEFIAPAVGSYRFWLDLDPDSALDFTVTEPRFELGETAMNEPLLRDLATVSGGAFFREETLYQLPETISAKTERVRSPLEVELWASPLYFLLLLGVVTAEWIFRKLSYLK